MRNVGDKIVSGEDGIRDTPDPAPTVHGDELPSKEEIEDYLNSVYGKQCNLWFNVSNYETKVVYFESEVETITDLFDRDYSTGGVDGYFEYAGALSVTKEEERLDEQAPPLGPPGAINVYIFPVPMKGTIEKARPIGFANAIDRNPYIAASHYGKAGMLWTIAHEIGHNGILSGNDPGLRHPWYPPADNKLDTVNLVPQPFGFPRIDPKSDEDRLMWHDIHNTDDSVNPPNGRLLKVEWEIVRGVHRLKWNKVRALP